MAHRGALLVLVLLLGTSRVATALTILDVVQLSQHQYSDAQIIAIIEATNAVFELEAADLPRLKQLGVSEAVIRAMLKRRPPPSMQVSGDSTNPAVGPPPTQRDVSQVAPPRATSLADLAQRANGQRQAPRSASVPSPASIVRPTRAGAEAPALSIGNVPRPLVSSFPVAEARAGDHAHMAIALGGLEVMVLRDEASSRSIAERAALLAAQLEAARGRGDGEFQYASVGGRDAVVFRSASNQAQFVVMSVTARDARAYEIRSARMVSAPLLARYWADVLDDYWSIIVRHTAPTRLTSLRDGEALTTLFRAFESDTADDQREMQARIGTLPSSVQRRLQQLVRTVPIDYGNRLKEGL